jgi:tetratricopeptide (TPR) repeat protein
VRRYTGLFVITGVAIGFAIGFLVANSVNRSEINGLRAEIDSLRSSTQTDKNELSDEEIRDKIAEADQNPQNISYQKSLGLALYRYGAIKNNTTIIAEAVRLLERASQLAPNDKDITIGLANAQFDIGYANKDNDSLSKAREAYKKVLSGKDDADIRTDLGMTYFLQEPPDDENAIAEFKRVLAVDPQNQKALEFIIQSLVRTGNQSDAAKYLEKLRQSHPNDPSLTNLQTQVEKGRS